MSSPIVLHALLAGLAGASLWAQMTYRIPGRSVFFALPWLGPAVACLGPLLLVNAVVGRINASGLTLQRVARWALAMAFALGGLAFVMPVGWIPGVVTPEQLWTALVFAYFLVVAIIAGLVSAAAPPIVLRALKWLERVALVLVAGFIVVGVVAFVNGRFDTSPVSEMKTQIRDIGWADIEFDRALEYGWADLRSWRRVEGIERIFLSRSERVKSWPGQAIVVRLRKGTLGLPWVVGIGPDLEEENRRILAIAPNARAARAVLIEWYLEHHQWQEATAQTLEYLERFPTESEHVRGIAAKLGLARQEAAARRVLEPLAARHPTPAILGLTGWVMNLTGDRQRSIELLESAIRLDPDDWINYYRLGAVYRAVGRYDEAITSLEQALERRPNFPEVEQQLTWLRGKVRQRGSAAR